jgi:hypothetical protein
VLAPSALPDRWQSVRPAWRRRMARRARARGLQAQIDDMYADCDGLSFTNGGGTATWEEVKADTKTSVEACGCGGAAQAAPLFAALAAVANHFLN